MPERGAPGYLTSELARRKIPRVALGYFFGGLAILEAADLILPSLFMPESAYRIVLAAVLVGFPIALVLAWTFEFTPHGIRRERPASPDDTGPPVSGLRRALVPFLLMAIVILAWRPWRAGDVLAGLTEAGLADSVAVLPIENRTTNADNDHLAAAITEEIVQRLQRNDRIKVIDPYSVTNLLERGITDRELVDSLGVATLVRASLYGDDELIWVNVTASDGRSGSVAWTGRYQASAADGYGAVSTIAHAFGSEYENQMPALSVQEYAAPNLAGLIGKQELIEGQRLLARRTFDGIARARDLFLTIVQADPADAEAFALTSQALSLSLAYRYQGGPEGYEAAGLAMAFATRAIELDPNLGAAYAARGLLASRSQAPLGLVAEDCRQALALNPNAADGLSWCGRVLKELGWTSEALDNSEKAIAVDPRNAGRRVALAYDAMSMGRHEKALEEARAARALSPGLALPRVLEARALLLGGRAAECLALDLGPHAAMRATCLHETGRVAEARAIIDSVATAVSARDTHDTVFTDLVRAEDLAVYYAWTGDADMALSWIRMAYDLSPWVEARTLESDLFKPVRSRPGFRRAVAAIQDSVWMRVEAAAVDARRSHPLLAGAAS
jgi:adenylate cyclase